MAGHRLRQFPLSALVAIVLAAAAFSAAAAGPGAGPHHAAAVFVNDVPEGYSDAVAPRPLAAAAVSHIRLGNARGGTAALREYRAAFGLIERYRRAGGNHLYVSATASSLARGFFERGDVADARRAWRSIVAAGTGYYSQPGDASLDVAVAAAAERRFPEALRWLAAGYGNATGNGTGNRSTQSLSAPDRSPDSQFDRGLSALGRGDRDEARRWMRAATTTDPRFAQAQLCLGVLSAASGNRQDAVREWLDAGTAEEGYMSPDIRNYGSPEAARAARLLLAFTAY
jgi:tetratricopeptide (TPR) repeat protein